MPPVGFEPTIAVLERAKTVRALDRSATAIGYHKLDPKILTSKNKQEATQFAAAPVNETNRRKKDFL
jgi:hypothetical protein